MTTTDRQITLTLDAATGDRLEAAAALEGISVDEYCKEAIEVQLDEDEIYRAPVKLTQEYVDRFARIREETANMNATERATEPKGRTRTFRSARHDKAPVGAAQRNIGRQAVAPKLGGRYSPNEGRKGAEP